MESVKQPLSPRLQIYKPRISPVVFHHPPGYGSLSRPGPYNPGRLQIRLCHVDRGLGPDPRQEARFDGPENGSG